MHTAWWVVAARAVSATSTTACSFNLYFYLQWAPTVVSKSAIQATLLPRTRIKRLLKLKPIWDGFILVKYVSLSASVSRSVFLRYDRVKADFESIKGLHQTQSDKPFMIRAIFYFCAVWVCLCLRCVSFLKKKKYNDNKLIRTSEVHQKGLKITLINRKLPYYKKTHFIEFCSCMMCSHFFKGFINAVVF